MMDANPVPCTGQHEQPTIIRTMKKVILLVTLFGLAAALSAKAAEAKEN